jgi:hypothetical protein
MLPGGAELRNEFQRFCLSSLPKGHPLNISGWEEWLPDRQWSRRQPGCVRRNAQPTPAPVALAPPERGAVKKLTIDYFQHSACAGAPAPPGETRAPHAFPAADSEL